MIQLQNVYMEIKDQTIQVKDFLFEKGNKYIIKAPSGFGKTTLMEAYIGLRPNVFGSIVIDGEQVNHQSIKKIRSLIAYLPQDVPNFNVLVKEVIDSLINDYDQMLLKDLLEVVELEEEKLNQNFQMLSGGEKKRLGILIALLLDRPILLLDELDHGVDVTRLIKILDYLSTIDKLIIINSHHPTVLEHQGFQVLGGELFG